MTENLFDYAARYPNAPGHRKRDTSQAAAARVSGVEEINARILSALQTRPMTDYQLADWLGETHKRVQPRRSTLAAAGKLVDSGKRAQSPYGRAAIVWQIPT